MTLDEFRAMMKLIDAKSLEKYAPDYEHGARDEPVWYRWKDGAMYRTDIDALLKAGYPPAVEDGWTRVG